MIRAEVKFKNSAFIKALEKSNYESIADFSRKSGISYQRLIEYANLRYSFGDLSVKVKISKLLNSDLHTLFDQYEKVIEKNRKYPRKIIKEIPVDNLLSADSKEVLQIQSDYNVDDFLNEDSLKIDIADALNNLKDRERLVVEMHHGLNGFKEMSFTDIAEELGNVVKRERVRQIYQKAIRRLRHRSKSEKLKNYIYIKKEERD